jgi:hypothetical protein
MDAYNIVGDGTPQVSTFIYLVCIIHCRPSFQY